MTHHEYIVYLQGLAKIVLTPVMPKTMNRSLAVWWEFLLKHVGVSEIPIGRDLGEGLTWAELLMVHEYLYKQIEKQFESAVALLPDTDGREVLSRSLRPSDLKPEKEKK